MLGHPASILSPTAFRVQPGLKASCILKCKCKSEFIFPYQNAVYVSYAHEALGDRPCLPLHIPLQAPTRPVHGDVFMPLFFHPNVLQPGISILQTPECLHGRQLPGSGPRPLPGTFLPRGPAPAAPGGTALSPQSYHPSWGPGLRLAHQPAKGQAPENRLWV